MKNSLDEKEEKQITEKFESFKSYEYTDDDFDKVLKNEDKIKQKVGKDGFGEYAEYVPLFFNMIKDYFSGQYKEIPKGSIAAIICSLLYILSPIDVIPDFIPVVGLLDDIFVLGLCISFVKADIDKYKNWKENKTRLDEEYSEETQ